MPSFVDKPKPKKRVSKNSGEGGRRLVFVLKDGDTWIDSDVEFFPMWKKAYKKPHLSVTHEWVKTGVR